MPNTKITLVIPDVHHKIDRAEDILNNAPHERVVWLGDFFDDFGDSPNIAVRTAVWLKQRIDSTEDVFLLGNHDAMYFWPNVPELRCSGYSAPKAMVIESAIDLEKYRRRFILYAEVGKWLLSHAGLHPQFGTSVSELAPATAQAIAYLENGSMHALLAAGWSRGGDQQYGGITWLDWSELIPIDGVNQIVGHTPGNSIRRRHTLASSNMCLDTNLAHYAIISKHGDVKIWHASSHEPLAP